MAYIPTEWKNGDVITAEKLNNMEEGISKDTLVIITEIPGMTTTYSCNMTFEELRDLIPKGTISSIVHFRHKMSSTSSGTWDFIAGIYLSNSDNIVLNTININGGLLYRVDVTSQNSVQVTRQKIKVEG